MSTAETDGGRGGSRRLDPASVPGVLRSTVVRYRDAVAVGVAVAAESRLGSHEPVDATRDEILERETPDRPIYSPYRSVNFSFT